MKSYIKMFIIALVLPFFLCIGCASNPIKVGSVDSQFNYDSIDWTKGRSISASASGFQLLLVIPININDRQEKAYQILRGQAGNDYISDVKIKEAWTYGLIGTVYTTTIETTAYPRK